MTQTPFPTFNIVLVEPEIPPNTGNIARLCAATGTNLHLVGKLGFSLDDRYLKRAGLDYWPHVSLHIWDSLEQLHKDFTESAAGNWWYTSKTADKSYTQATFSAGDFIVFGKETKGLPKQLLADNPDNCLLIPLAGTAVRSLNLSTSAGIVLYEALRQVDTFNV
ncbi:MAG: tRNA (uridine(34)/cytosine(34)/5-carboxymethylaminomethyluridine(34)-2'-O)-methyltransferase TrmL [Desulfobacteraceae bacterium 4572_35.1]|nr:MAG: tRNA (uridine(34)/cytosine(34)/5-carboxymethylaminomethyluridine(34)-2'-O)-methyltransferase TrmL [Desulfobacteraceae bacterium 4572_35.1]